MDDIVLGIPKFNPPKKRAHRIQKVSPIVLLAEEIAKGVIIKSLSVTDNVKSCSTQKITAPRRMYRYIISICENRNIPLS
jgi:hypothetical protein